MQFTTKAHSTNKLKDVWRVIHSIAKMHYPTSYEHFRPISVIPTLSRVFEKLVAKQMTTFCELNSTLNTVSGTGTVDWDCVLTLCLVLMGIHVDLIRAMKKGK